MKFCHHKLDNGLDIVAECNPQAYTTAIAFFVKTGSRDESDKISGVSHFLEHMAFKGTPTRSAADVNRELDEIGSQSNAFTSEEQTVYYATVLPEYQEHVVRILADIMRPSLRKDDFETEKKVIIEEICKYDDQPPFGAHDKCMAAFFSSHPLRHNILGTVESVTDLTPEAMREYFQRRYSPGNMALVAAGRVDWQELTSLAEKLCGDWKPYPTEREAPRAKGTQGFQIIQKESASQQYIVQIAEGPAAEDDDRFASRLLTTILGDDSGSRFYWDLIETGKAECAGMGACEYQGTGIIMTYLSCQPQQTAENLQQVLDLQREAEKNGITQDELDQAQSKICSHIVLSSERPSSRLFSVGNNWVQRNHYRTVREVIEKYQSVTCDEVNQVLSRYPLSKNSTIAIGPLKELNPPQ